MQGEWSEAEELEFLLNHPFIGGDGEDGGDTGNAGEAEGEGEAAAGAAGETGEGARKPGDTGERDANGQMIPKHRFDEVNRGYQEYKSLGDSKAIKAKLDRLAQLEAMPQNRYTDKETKEIEADLVRALPWLGHLRQQYETSQKAFTSGGAKLSEGFAKEIGIEANEDNHHFIQELVGAAIFKDPDLKQRFFALDNTVFKDAWTKVKGQLWKNSRSVPGLSVAGKKLPPSAPAGKPGAKGKKEEVPDGPLGDRDLLDQAGEDAFARLAEQM